MRVLQIVDVRWWNACAYYGVELARALRTAGHAPVVAGAPASPAIRRARELGLEVWASPAFDEQRPWRSFAQLPRFAARLGRFDLIVAHRAPGHLLAAIAAASRGGPPVIRTRGDSRLPRRHAGNRFLHRRLTAAHVVPSRRMQTQLVEQFDLDPAGVHLVPAGIDLDRHAPAPGRERGATLLRAAHGIPTAAPCLAIVARLSPVKGHAVLLEALAEVETTPPVHLLVAGQEEEVLAADLERQAAALGLAGRVHVLGCLADVRPVLSAADLLIIPSLGSEAICRILLEGMAAAVPAVASTVGVIGEMIVRGETGLLVPPGEPGALATAIHSLLIPWPERRASLRSLGEAARRRARAEYGLETWVERTEQVYRSVLAARRSPKTEAVRS